METDLVDEGTAEDGSDPGIAGPAGAGAPDTPEASIDTVEHVLDQVEEALSRLDDGSYGCCGSCGASIEDARLADAPMTQTCEACASAPTAGPASGRHLPGSAGEEAAVPDPDGAGFPRWSSEEA